MQKLLYLTHRIPYPPNKGDKIRSYHVLQHLRKHFKVYLGTFIDDEQDWQYVNHLNSLCEETCFVRLDPLLARMRSLIYLFSSMPLSLPYYRSSKLSTWVSNQLSSGTIKHTVVFSSAMAQYISETGIACSVIDFVDVDSDKWSQYASTKVWPQKWVYQREADLLLEYEKYVTKKCSYATFVSEKEAGLFKQLSPEVENKITYFNNGVDTEYFSPSQNFANPYKPGTRVLVFTGAMDYWPNVDAVRWFAAELFPAIRTKIPDLEFYIVGARPTKTVLELSAIPGVVVTGSVDDVRPYLAFSEIAIAPLRIARGIQNKVLEAMAMEKLVVASPQALEGITAIPGIELFVADGAEAYIDHVISLLENPRMEAGKAARRRVIEDYNWDKNLSRIDRLLQVSS
ncbi:MAG: TIGR03087 family PEP-CTERM/XrtA system glycosyltransferase [Nitrosomonas sp.]|nr:MAG: TIGR03087 family PEP-CTERM/XrtA system glycosyltransferase [Nitrosomonas sp.]HNC41160.1 TIGR03087 family PEP-CTERM/XrtA system glycosyltransferase [Nitrosomonas sp.]